MSKPSPAQWYLVYVALVVIGGICLYFVSCGGKALEVLSFLLLIYGVVFVLYSLLRFALSGRRNRFAAQPEITTARPPRV